MWIRDEWIEEFSLPKGYIRVHLSMKWGIMGIFLSFFSFSNFFLNSLLVNSFLFLWSGDWVEISSFDVDPYQRADATTPCLWCRRCCGFFFVRLLLLLHGPIKFKMMEWQNVLYCVQSSRLSSEEVSSREERIGEECIHDGMKERRKKEKKKTVRSWVGRNVCVVSLGLALPGASQIRPSLSFSRSLEWPLEQDKKTRNWQLHRRNETVGFFSI
jgi:hypothetical protein